MQTCSSYISTTTHWILLKFGWLESVSWALSGCVVFILADCRKVGLVGWCRLWFSARRPDIRGKSLLELLLHFGCAHWVPRNHGRSCTLSNAPSNGVVLGFVSRPLLGRPHTRCHRQRPPEVEEVGFNLRSRLVHRVLEDLCGRHHGYAWCGGVLVGSSGRSGIRAP